MLTPNPKTVGSPIIDCRLQTGICPLNCHQCFYNRPKAFYVPIDKPYIPVPVQVEDKIVRMNCGHDSGLQKDLVIKTAIKYKNFFFNTSIANTDFPNPVVLTANPNEEKSFHDPSKISHRDLANIMFVRLRVSASNLNLVAAAIRVWTEYKIPIVLTYMAYYEKEAMENVINRVTDEYLLRINLYEWRVRNINSYFCPTKEFVVYVLQRMKGIGGRLVTKCGTLDSAFCRDCGNCAHYYKITKKHLNEI